MLRIGNAGGDSSRRCPTWSVIKFIFFRRQSPFNEQSLLTLKCITPTHFIATLHFISSRWDQLSSDDAVKRVLAGEKGDMEGRPSLTSRPQDLDNKSMREDASRARKDKEVNAGYVCLK